MQGSIQEQTVPPARALRSLPPAAQQTPSPFVFNRAYPAGARVAHVLPFSTGGRRSPSAVGRPVVFALRQNNPMTEEYRSALPRPSAGWHGGVAGGAAMDGGYVPPVRRGQSVRFSIHRSHCRQAGQQDNGESTVAFRTYSGTDAHPTFFSYLLRIGTKFGACPMPVDIFDYSCSDFGGDERNATLKARKLVARWSKLLPRLASRSAYHQARSAVALVKATMPLLALGETRLIRNMRRIAERTPDAD